MTFEEKVKFLRALPLFKVSPISEVRAIAFIASETNKQDSVLLGKFGSISLFLSQTDIKKITREYPDFEARLQR